ncbi:MAG TPA: hypothetical protein VLE48_02970 [Terriglobales bacterium]|nr:hypothetical protein [Terriglobales bacterium]
MKSLNRRILASLALFLLLPGLAASAQHKNELGLLLGVNLTPAQGINVTPVVNNNDRLTFDRSLAMQATYARQLRQWEKVALYLEVPFMGISETNVNTTNTSVAEGYALLFVTPGLRAKFRPEARVSPWLSVGGGYARIEPRGTLVDGTTPNPTVVNSNAGALQMGGGADVKAFWRLSFRGEVRDFYTAKPRLNVDTFGGRQHNVVVSGGIVFGF